MNAEVVGQLRDRASDARYVQNRLELLRPGAKFTSYSHSSDFIAPEAQLGEGFHYANLYDEQIDANVIQTPRGIILIHNTYLPSFAYNLLLCWFAMRGPIRFQRGTFIDSVS